MNPQKALFSTAKWIAKKPKVKKKTSLIKTAINNHNKHSKKLASLKKSYKGI